MPGNLQGLLDTVVWPREGEWWGQAKPGEPFDGTALTMNQSSWYLKDTFGLRTAYALPSLPARCTACGLSFGSRTLAARSDTLTGSFVRQRDEEHKNHFESFMGEHIRMTDPELYGWIAKYFH